MAETVTLDECHAIDGDEVCRRPAFADVIMGAHESWPICRYHAAQLDAGAAVTPRGASDA